MQDAVVIGGGPAGSLFAFELANRGLAVTVFEEHLKIGVPSHCAGHLSIRSLRNLGLYPLPKGIVENTFSVANFYSSRGTKFSVHLAQPVTCAVDRTKFDVYLAERAQTAGAKFHLGQRVQSLFVKENFVKGVNVAERDGSTKPFFGKLVVDAEGISSRLLRQAGLQGLKREALVYAVEAEIEGVLDVEEHAVDVYLGKDFAPGFYAWLIPRRDGTAKLGLATQKGNPKDHIERFMCRHPVASKQLKNARVTHMNFHAITLGGPIPKAYSNGFLAIGDCASQVKPTTGGGVVFGITCSRIAAEVASQVIQKDDFSATALKIYQKRFMDVVGFDIKVMLRIRRMVNSFSDEKLDRALRFATKVGLDKAFWNVDEIDFQGRTLLSMFKKPSAYAALAYFFKMLLPENA